MATVYIYKVSNGLVVRQYPKSVQEIGGLTAPTGYAIAKVTRDYNPNEMIGRIRQSDGTVVLKTSNFPTLTGAQALAKVEDFLRPFNRNVYEQHWLFEDTFKGTPNKARVEQSIKATRVWGWGAGAVLYGLFTGTLFTTLSYAQKWAIVNHIYAIFLSPKFVRTWYSVMQADATKRTAWAGFLLAPGSALYVDYITAAGAVRNIDGTHLIIAGVIPAGYLPQV